MVNTPSALPLRTSGTRTRAGNAMGRTRAALIDGALKSIAAHGTRGTSMAEVADLGLIARATLYNHFRRKGDIFTAVIEHAIEQMRSEALEKSTLNEALAAIVTYLSTSPALATVVEREPAVVTTLTTITDHELWVEARSALTDVFAKFSNHEPDAIKVDIALRWLLTQISSPTSQVGPGKDLAASISRLV